VDVNTKSVKNAKKNFALSVAKDVSVSHVNADNKLVQK